MSSTLRLSRSILAMLITIGMVLAVMPSRIINAETGGDVYYLFAKLAKQESGTYTAVSAYRGNDPTDAHDGCEYFKTMYAGYRYNDKFVVPGTTAFCLNDAQAFYDGNFGSSPDYLLLGSTLVFNDIMVSSRTDNSILGISQYGDQAYVVLVNEILSHAGDTYKYEVGSSQTFNISTKSDGTGSVFETDDLTVNGKINIGCNSYNIDKPNILSISNDGTLTAGEGSITGSGNALLEICAGATVTGGLVLYDTDGVTPVTVFENSETFRYQGGKWIKNTGEGSFGDFGIFFNYEKEYILGEIEYSLDGRNWKPLEGEEKARIYLESIENVKGIYARFTLVATPKDNSLLLVNGKVPQAQGNGLNSRIFYIEREGNDWEGKYDVDFLLEYEPGVYFANETGSDLSVKYGFSKDAVTADAEYGAIPASALGNNNGLYFKLVSSLDHLQTGICCVTDREDNREFRPEGDDVYFMEKGSGWDDVFVVHVRQQQAGIILDDRGGDISNFTYKLGSGNPVALDGNFIAKEIFENSDSITISYSIADSFTIGNAVVMFNGKAEMVNGRHFSFDPKHPETITIYKNGNWGTYYDVQFVPGQTQPAETFNIEFPDSMNVIRNLEFTTDDVNSGNVTWRPATRDENGGRYYIEAEKNWTAITIKMTPCDHITDGLDVRFESLAQNGAEPAAMSGIAVNNNQFTLVKPYEGENPDWAYGYIVTVTAKNDNPTPTPDPQNELAKFGGYRIRLDGYVGISYYVALDQGIRDSNTKITFTFDSMNPEISKQEIGFDSARYVAEPGAGDFYVFDFKVAPNDMTKTITATLTNGDYSLTFEQFTARDYVDYYAKHGTGNLAALANSIKNYGYYTQLKFGPSDPIFAGDAMTLTDPSYERVTVGSIQDGISYSGSSVVFLSGNKIKHYFTITSNPDAYTFKVNGKTVNKVPEGGNLYSVSTEEIPASVLATGISVEVLYNGNAIKSFSYSAMNYAKAVVDTQGTTSEMKNLVKAFAMYYDAVNAYNNPGN